MIMAMWRGRLPSSLRHCWALASSSGERGSTGWYSFGDMSKGRAWELIVVESMAFGVSIEQGVGVGRNFKALSK